MNTTLLGSLAAIGFADDIVPVHHHHVRYYILFAYGVFLIIGGVIGYVKAKSTPSLIAGGVSGILAIILGLVYHTFAYAPHAALLLSLVLAVVMFSRYQKSKKAMPSLYIVIFSLLVAAVQAYVLYRIYS